MRFRKFWTDDRLRRRRWLVRLPIGDGFIPIDFARARARPRRRVRSRWRTLTSISGTTGNPRGRPSASSLRARKTPTPPSRLPRRETTTWRRRRHRRRRRRRPRPCRSAPLVHHPGVSERNIWPGRPDVSYWRNMAQSREIFPRSRRSRLRRRIFK